MDKKFEIKDVNELMNALGDHEKLYGYKPAEEYKATSFVYPLTIIANEEDKTYIVRQANEIEEGKKEEPKNDTPTDEGAPKVPEQSAPAQIINEKSKKRKIGMIIGFTILGIAIVVGVALAIYFGVK